MLQRLRHALLATTLWPEKIAAFWRTLIKRPAVPSMQRVAAIEPPIIETAPEPDAPQVKPIAAKSDLHDDPELPNRAMRRKYERARHRHDKFVKPQGPEPVVHPREHYGPPVHYTKTDPIPIPENESEHIDLRGKLIVDRHHEDGEFVLYEEDEFCGHFTFRDTILAQLDRYWVYLRRMQRHDPEAYGFYRQIGGVIEPYMATGLWYRERSELIGHRDWKSEWKLDGDLQKELPPWFLRHRPAFGCIAFGTSPLNEQRELEDTQALRQRGEPGRIFMPKFFYFVKYTHPPSTMQHVNGGDTYRFTVWWDRPHDEKARIKWGVPQEFGIFVSTDGGRVQVLRTLARHRDGSKYWREWRIPHELQTWAKQHGTTAQKYLTHLFVDTVNAFGSIGESMVQINVHKDDLTAIFTVDHRRLAYFFQDRDYDLTEGGTRKKIFHSVRPHLRDGSKPIKLHFRGERHFMWAGYDVLITVPGLHHEPLTEFSPGVEEYTKPGPIPKDHLTSDQIAAGLAKHIAGAPLRDVFK